jgi:hypothetical protein
MGCLLRSVIIGDLNLMCSIRFPDKADLVLVNDPDAALPGTVAVQRLEAIAGRRPKIDQIERGLDLIQFSACDCLNPCPLSA